MILTKQNLEDYNQFILEMKGQFQKDYTEYAWDFRYYSDDMDDTRYFIITNRHKTTKVLYSTTSKIISTVNIYSQDLTVIQKLKEML